MRRFFIGSMIVVVSFTACTLGLAQLGASSRPTPPPAAVVPAVVAQADDAEEAAPAPAVVPTATARPRPTATPTRAQRQEQLAAAFTFVSFHMEPRRFGTGVDLIGEIRNDGDTAAGVELQAIGRDADGAIVDSTTFWPASTRNIDAGESSPIKYFLTKPGISTVDVKVVSARVW
ncbi:MAG TPA: hypothetical protein VII06_09555 [Chloroflexota bacterium]|jgi:hypothetical protein